MKKLWEYMSPLKWYMLGGLMLKFFAALMNLCVPALLSLIIDVAVPRGSKTMIFAGGGLMILCAGADFVSNIAANRMATRSAGAITLRIRRDVFEKISYFSARQTDTFTIPKLISVLTSDTYNVNQMLARMQRMGIRAPALLIGGLVITFSMDSALAGVLAAMLPLIGVIVYIVTKYSMPVFTSIMEQSDEMVRVVRENFSGIRVIKALSKTDYERSRFETVNDGLFAAEKKSVNIMSASNPLTTLVLNLGLCAVVLVGAHRVDSGLTQAGEIIAFMTYFTVIVNAMLGVTRIFMMYSKGAASMNRIAEVLASENELYVLDIPPEKTDSHIVFDDVTFSYNKRKNNIEHISFSLKRGETLGIIGATGSGKSTLISLLIRFYDADSGRILIDGKDVRSMEKDELYQKLAVVFQSDFMLSDTVEENVRFGRDVTDEEVEEALLRACAAEFVSAFPNGKMHEITAGGTNISGGQKQRLFISRALAKQPEILILDDSSSALDYKTDSVLRKNLNRYMKETTKIIVAQRISAVKNSDRILMLDGGRMQGYGTHEELMLSCPQYREIYDMQMGGGEA